MDFSTYIYDQGVKHLDPGWCWEHLFNCCMECLDLCSENHWRDCKVFLYGYCLQCQLKDGLSCDLNMWGPLEWGEVADQLFQAGYDYAKENRIFIYL